MYIKKKKVYIHANYDIFKAYTLLKYTFFLCLQKILFKTPISISFLFKTLVM